MNPKKLLKWKMLFRPSIGLAVLALVILFSGPSEVLTLMGRGLWAFGTVIVLSAAALAFRAAAWKIALTQNSKDGKMQASLLATLVALLAVGGTPIRLALLKKKAGIADGAGSVVADQAVRALAAMIFAGLGLLFGFLFAPGDFIVRGFLIVVAAGGLGYLVVSLKRRQGFFASLLGGLPKRFVSPAVRGKYEERDRYFQRFRAQNPGGFYTSLVIHLVVFGLFALEILAVGTAIDAGFPGALGLGLAGLILIFRYLFSKIPASLGVLEGGVALVLALTFGAPLAALGTAVVLILRLRTLAWWCVGFAAAGNPLKILFGK
jgi:hypothetical protein